MKKHSSSVDYGKKKLKQPLGSVMIVRRIIFMWAMEYPGFQKVHCHFRRVFHCKVTRQKD